MSSKTTRKLVYYFYGKQICGKLKEFSCGEKDITGGTCEGDRGDAAMRERVGTEKDRANAILFVVDIRFIRNFH